MSKKAFKTSLKLEVEKSIPNVLHKIDLGKIDIKEPMTTRTTSYRKPLLKLAYSLSMAVLVLLVVVIIATSTRPTNLYAKDDEAVMASAIQAYQISNTETVSNSSNITLSSSEDLQTYDEFFNEVTSEIDQFFESIETILMTRKFKLTKLSQVSFDYELNLESKQLSGTKVVYQSKYSYTTEDGNTIIEGVLLANDQELTTFRSTITNLEDGSKVIETVANGVTIKTWSEDQVRVFETTRNTPLGQKTSVIKHYIVNGKETVELIPESFIVTRRYVFSKSTIDNNPVIEVEINDEYKPFQIGKQYRIKITARELSDRFEYHYDFHGKITVLGIGVDYHFETTSRRRKR